MKNRRTEQQPIIKVENDRVIITGLLRPMLYECLNAFGGTFTGVLAALLTAHCPSKYAAEKATEVAEAVSEDLPNDMGVVLPVSILSNEDGVKILYRSRSGNEYVFSIGYYYDNSIEYPIESSLAQTFNDIATKNIKQ